MATNEAQKVHNTEKLSTISQYQGVCIATTHTKLHNLYYEHKVITSSMAQQL